MSRFDRAIARAELRHANLFGLPPRSWAATRRSGGITAAATEQSIGNWAGGVYAGSPTRDGAVYRAPTPPGVPVGTQPWLVIGESAATDTDDTLREGDTLTAGGYTFRVGPAEYGLGFVRYLAWLIAVPLEPIAGWSPGMATALAAPPTYAVDYEVS